MQSIGHRREIDCYQSSPEKLSSLQPLWQTIAGKLGSGLCGELWMRVLFVGVSREGWEEELDMQQLLGQVTS
jgi:hypothetical protein